MYSMTLKRRIRLTDNNNNNNNATITVLQTATI